METTTQETTTQEPTTETTQEANNNANVEAAKRRKEASQYKEEANQYKTKYEELNKKLEMEKMEDKEKLNAYQNQVSELEGYKTKYEKMEAEAKQEVDKLQEELSDEDKALVSTAGDVWGQIALAKRLNGRQTSSPKPDQPTDNSAISNELSARYRKAIKEGNTLEAMNIIDEAEKFGAEL